MLTVTINIAGAGTPTTTGPSFAGHMWYSLDDGSGIPPASYGFAPVENTTGTDRAFGPGTVHHDDDTAYQGPRTYTKTIEITQAQYDAMKNFGDNPAANGFSTEYNGINNSCIDFTWKAMEKGGFNAVGFQGDHWPTWNGVDVDIAVALHDFAKNLISFGLGLGNSINIENAVNDWWNAARSWTPPRGDPLALDLDGDGIETIGANGTVLFDHDGDGIKTASGWVKADDGLLVLDRNGNGKIDTGAELFGVDTVLANGQKASDGFAALRDLDANGFAALAELDSNQDGISQTGELKTLAESGVQSIKLASTATNTNYGDAILVQSGTYTRTVGSTGQAGSFILAQNNFVRTFTAIAASAEAMVLPDIKGSGWVRDLQEAATLSPELIAAFNQVRDATTRADYKEAVATLLREWGNDSGYDSASKQAMADGYGLILSDPQDDQERGWMDNAIKASAADRDAYRATLTEADRAKFDAMRERMVGGLERTYAYEAFTGYTLEAANDEEWRRVA